LQERHNSIVASLLALPSLAALAVGTVSTRVPVLAPGTAPPPGRAIDLALHKNHYGGTVTESLDRTWVSALTALTLSGQSSRSGDVRLTDLACVRRLAALKLVGVLRAHGPVPPSLAAGLTSLTVRLPRRRSYPGVRMAWPAGGWPALRSLTVCTGEGPCVVCLDADGGDAEDYRARLTKKPKPALSPAAAFAAGAALGARLHHLCFITGGAPAEAGWGDFERGVLSTLRPPLALDRTVRPPPPPSPPPTPPRPTA
jgi:hypothetical protein